MQRTRRLRPHLYLALFIVVLAVPAMVHLHALVTAAEVTTSEQRELASPPAMPRSVDDALEFSSHLDAYMADAFGLRAQLVEWYARLNHRLGVSTNDEVMIGRNGRLFFRAQGAEEQILRTTTLDDDELAAWDRYLDEVVEHAQKVDAQVVFTVAPNSQRVHVEDLPAWVLPDVEAARGPTELDQFVELLAARDDVTYVDIATPLREAGRRGQHVYRTYDTHWTDQGAFLGYRTLWDAVFGTSAGVQADQVTYGLQGHAGDLADMLGLGTVLQEQLPIADVEAPVAVTQPLPEGPTATRASLTHGAPAGPRVVLIGDSFGRGLLPFAGPSSSSLLYENHERGKVDLAWIDEMEPDLVVVQVVERWLGEPFGTR